MRYRTFYLKDGSVYVNVIKTLQPNEGIVELHIGFTRPIIIAKVGLESIEKQEWQDKYIKNPKKKQ